jgi:UDP-glucose 4-epimerase
LITGSSGFVGTFLGNFLQSLKYSVINTYRTNPDRNNPQDQHVIGNIDADTQWQTALLDVDAVVHLAARVHIMEETVHEPINAFRQVNTQGTLNLAKQAVEAGVKRFIYLSTIKVNGEQTFEKSFLADDTPNPQEPYAVSKFETEQQLLKLGQETGLEVVIIRPVLVYGPGVKGNFLRLMQLVNKGLPLPLGGIKNKRSLVSVTNLCSLITLCLNHEKAAGEVFLISDGQDLSTSELFKKIAAAMHKPSRLFFLPARSLYWLTRLLKRTAEYERLCGSLQVDISKNEQLLGWKPKQSVEEGIQMAVAWYRNKLSGK